MHILPIATKLALVEHTHLHPAIEVVGIEAHIMGNGAVLVVVTSKGNMASSQYMISRHAIKADGQHRRI